MTASPDPASVPLTGLAFVDGLVQSSVWQLDATRTLTFAFYDTDFYEWTDIGREAIRLAVALWQEVANIDFVEVAPDGGFNDNSTDLAFWVSDDTLSTLLSPNTVAAAGFPDPPVNDLILASSGVPPFLYPTIEGDVYFNANAEGSIFPGGLLFYAALHEIGHALGLKHPFDDGLRGSPTFAELGIEDFDSAFFTVMSYDSLGDADFGNAATPMLFDIAAIQYLYGANTTTRAGDDLYVAFDTDFLQLNTLWDAGGNDTLDGSALTAPAIIDMREAGFSIYGDGNVTVIAFGVVIEAAFGGAGDDEITGNDAVNLIDANGGNDTMTGGGGNDFMIGDAGADSGSGGEADDVLFGGSGIDSLAGDAGNDFLFGDDGLDTMDGGAGNDRLHVDAGDALATGGDGIFDVLVVMSNTGGGLTAIDLGNAQNQNASGTGPLLSGLEAVDASLAAAPVHISGAALNGFGNVLFGSAFADSIAGSGAADIILGNPGLDQVDGGGGDDTLIADAGNDILTGGAGADAFFYPGGTQAGAVRVLDFSAADDVVVLGAGLGLSASQAIAQTVQAGADAVLSFGVGQSLTLVGVDAAALTAADFLIV